MAGKCKDNSGLRDVGSLPAVVKALRDFLDPVAPLTAIDEVGVATLDEFGISTDSVDLRPYLVDMNISQKSSLEAPPLQRKGLVSVVQAHDCESVISDARQTHRLLRRGSLAMFNDYTHYEQFLGSPCRIVQALKAFDDAGLFKTVSLAWEKNGLHALAMEKV